MPTVSQSRGGEGEEGCGYRPAVPVAFLQGEEGVVERSGCPLPAPWQRSPAGDVFGGVGGQRSFGVTTWPRSSAAGESRVRAGRAGGRAASGMFPALVGVGSFNRSLNRVRL